MKALIPLALLVAGSTAWAETKAHLEEAVAEFRGSFAAYKVSRNDVPSEELSAQKDERDLVKLETFSVVGSVACRDLENAIRDHAVEQEKTEIERSFSWKRGGLIASKKFGAVTADLGLWPELEGIYKRGAFGTANIRRLRVDLLHMRW